MTKEQEEAIEMLEDIKNNTWTTKYIMSSDSAKAETVLSMLKHNSAEIEQKNTELAEKNAEIERLNRQIDLMAETIRKLAISLASYEGSYNKETINFTGNIKDIKQYFEQKVTNNG